MEIIHVPAPPKEAFYKLRPISDLIKAQIKHFKHLEEKLPAEQRESIPQHRITTENDAAIYIAAMTRLLRSSAVGTATKPNNIGIIPGGPATGHAGGPTIAGSGTDAPKSSVETSGKSKSNPAPKKKKKK
jgi:hypothetical protein